MKVLITGSTGYVGRAITTRLARRADVIALSGRRRERSAPEGVKVAFFDLQNGLEDEQILQGGDAIIHLAAHVHVRRGGPHDDLARFREMNVEATRRLALAAARAGVRRFIFLSSLSVNGEESLERPFSETDTPEPTTFYGLSKWEAEVALREVSDESGLEVVIIRPPLIIGPDAPGNLKQLLRLIDTGLPVPLGSVSNHRQYVTLDSTLDFIELCLSRPQAANETFVLADSESLSTPEIIRRLAHHLGKPAMLAPCPVGLLKAVATCVGAKSALMGLWASVEASTSKAQSLLGWMPNPSLEQGLADTARAYREQKRRR